MQDEALDPVAVALDIARRLESLSVPYVIGGSLASSRHGEPRATLNVDIVAALTTRTARKLARDIDKTYYVDEHVAIDAARHAGSFNAVHLASAIKVDFFVAGDDPFERERLKLRERVTVGESHDAALWIDTAEHTILRKLEWYRRGGEVSDRQLRDVHAIIRVQRDALDVARLRKWAGRLGVSDLLQASLQQR
jgi:hypothetical protein